MSAREQILNRLRRAAHTAPHPEPWRSSRNFDDLAAQFAAALTEAGGEVHHAGTLEDALHQVGSLIASLGAERVVATYEPPLAGLDLPARWPQVTWHNVARMGAPTRLRCASFVRLLIWG